MTAFLLSLAFAGGYAASIYSWTWLKTKFLGAEAVAASLRTKAIALEAAVKSV